MDKLPKESSEKSLKESLKKSLYKSLDLILKNFEIPDEKTEFYQVLRKQLQQVFLAES